jgi:phospholipid/cholesterol/gamma-HCH transport system ATP-binding protein
MSPGSSPPPYTGSLNDEADDRSSSGSGEDETEPLAEPVVRCIDLDAGYGPKNVVLEDINLDFYKGQITTILGGSGSGKSTLLKTVVGLLPPLDGRVEVFGKDLYSLTPDERAELLQKTGMLYQYGALFGSKTVYENISLPVHEHTDLPESVVREMVRMKLGLVGLSGMEDKLASELSGGQQKRVALVRSAIMDPAVVFADEPSAGLDPVAAAGLDKLLRDFQDLFDMTMLVVTHVLESIKILSDRIVMVGDGGLKAVGTLEELNQSQDPDIRSFFHRLPPDYVAADRDESVLDGIEDEPRGGQPTR